ncbi:MAG: hypothetical protein D6689_01990 [Deltaproteobacteria bacterium]|nr:MAG: hypothetical protein D6689_01990 [Deltaproteobacteria bacterium]
MVLAQWTAHPARRRPRDVALVAAVVLLSTGAVVAWLQSLVFAAIAAGLLLGSVAPFWLPTRYRLTDAGIEQRRGLGRRARRWSELRRLAVGRDAALVSPLARPSWLDRYRGLVVLFDGGDRDAIVRILQERVGGGAR